MKKLIFLPIICFAILQASAQQRAAGIVLAKGQKIKMISRDTSNINQKRGEEAMDMKTLAASTTEVEILDVNKDGYTAAATIRNMKIDFDGYGQKISYDSDAPGKQEGMMAEQLKNVIGKADTISLDMNGKKTGEDEEGSKKGKGNGRGGGMMKMMNQGGANIENAFLIVPAGAGEGNGWKKDGSKGDVKTQTIYFIEKINGNLAIVSFKKKSKGTISRSAGQGGDMKIDLDNLSDGMITVDMSTGLVKTYRETTNSNSKTFMMGQEMPSTGTVVSDVVFE